jgi:AcrR family transcriptional regulator
MPRRQAERSDTTRRAIVAAARALFAEQGYEHTSIDQVVAAARTSKGAFYHHYRDKAEVLAAVYETMVHELSEHLLATTAEDDAAGAAGDPVELIAAGARRYLEAVAAPDYRQIALVDAPAVLGWQRWRQIDGDVGGFGLLRRGLQRAADAGAIAPDHLTERAHLLLAALSEASLLVAASDSPDDTRAVMTDLLHAQLQALRTPTPR